MDFPTLITNRTQSDVDNQTDKGFYNAADLNRVNSALRYLDGTLAQYGISSGFVEVEIVREDTALDPYTWYESDLPTQKEMDGYLGNVARMRSALDVFETTPQAPESMSGLTYTGANNIEKILIDVETVINQIVKSFVRSNAFTFWSGNRPLPCSKSDLGRTWSELDAMNTTWRNWQVADWYLLLYGNLIAEGDLT